MGAFDVSAYFKKFCSNIAIPQTKRSTMSMRRQAIAKRINKDFRGIDYDGYCFYAGSVGRNTANIGVSDIDMVCELPASVYHKYNAYQYNGQSAFLQAVKASIKLTYPNTELKGDGQVVVVTFSDGMKFEVVPAFLNTDNTTYTYADSNNGGSWKVMNPKAEIKAIKDGDAITNDNLHQLCRMMRSWKSYCNVPIKSCLLDTLAYRFLMKYEYKDKSYLYYDYMCRDFFLYLSKVDISQTYWQMVGSNHHIYCYDTFQNKAKKAYDKAVEAIDDDSKGYATCAKSDWREIFGSDFPYTI